ncbi:tetratricopeptide repeat protein [Flavobacterium sp.]|uniref:tetratricopeptide repeat protein n=1 Tax=Flavobacterium sp. TaxID=239 RepID=UPI00286D9D63|nr:tetratricopeptide repeat protein [Flavobacterium sp.]
MNKVKFLSIALVAFGFTTYAQEIELAKKAIDAEKFENAKAILRAAFKAKPDNGKLAFLLGNVYLKQNQADSAKFSFLRGVAAKENANFNYIGLGQMDLDNGNVQAAQFNFDQAVKDIKKKDIEQFIYIGKAFTQSEKPDYKKAILNLTKAKTINPNDPQTLLALGDAYYLDKNQNEAYAAYRNAFDADPTLVRAKVQLGVLLKEAKAYAEAKEAFDGVVAINPNFGPAYRELAETYNRWANSDKDKYKEYTAKSLGYYEKYMSLTDYSLASRMRHADFLIINKDYKALEKEALEMKKLDNVNPKILRYLGYSSYENGNPEAAIAALKEFIEKPTSKIIGRDYLFMGLAQIKIATPAAVGEAKPVINEAMFMSGVENLRKAVDIDKPMANELNEIGKKYFDQKLYKYAAAIYEVATSNPNSKNYLYDNFFLGYAHYFDNSDKEAKAVDVVALQKADKAFENVTVAVPTTQEAHIYRARVNALFPETPASQEQMAKSYEEYTKVVTAKGDAELAKPANKTKLIEAYYNLAKHFGKKDKVKANDFIAKAILIDPADADLVNLQKTLK